MTKEKIDAPNDYRFRYTYLISRLWRLIMRCSIQKFILNFVLVITAFVIMVGCIKTINLNCKCEPSIQKVQNDYFEATITPIFGNNIGSIGFATGIVYKGGCNAFNLEIQNKTDKNIEINWNKTMYISNGQTSGNFMYEGVIYSERNNPRPPDFVFAKSKFSKTIYPNNLVIYWDVNLGWRHEFMGDGENGVYLTILVEGKEIGEKITINITCVNEKEKSDNKEIQSMKGI